MTISRMVLANCAELFLGILSCFGIKCVPMVLIEHLCIGSGMTTKQMEDVFDFLLVCGAWSFNLLSFTCALIVAARQETVVQAGGVFGVLAGTLMLGWLVNLGPVRLRQSVQSVRLVARSVPFLLFLAKVILVPM